jgi:WD40 repeat protein
MNRRVGLVVGLLAELGFLISCDQRNGSSDLFSEESFNTRIELRDGRQIAVDDLLLGQPTLIRFHPDSYLVIEEFGTPRLIKILDLKTGKVQELIQRGRGPGEMLVSWGVEIIDRDIFLFCGQLRKIIILSPTEDRTFIIDDEFYIEEKQTQRLHPLSRDMYVCLSSIGDDRRFTLLDGKGKIIKKFGEYPPFTNDDEIKADNDIFFSSIGSTPDGKRFAAVCSKTDLFELYDIEKGLLKRFQGPLGLKISVEAQSVGTGFMLKPQPHYTTYHHVITNENEFWTAYIGYHFQKGKNQTLAEQCTKKLFCFDWQVTPLRMVILEYPAISFDIDWRNHIFYALEIRDNNTFLVEYSLDKVFDEAN